MSVRAVGDVPSGLILTIEDDAISGSSRTFTLKQAVRLVRVSDGEQALVQIADRHVDLILLDQGAPSDQQVRGADAVPGNAAAA